MRRRRDAEGFTLIEVLIALVVLSVGLLGMASLMTTSLQSNQGAYRRSQASLLTYDIVERMRLNRTQAISSDAYTLTTGATATSAPSCATGGCTASEQAQMDLYQWRAMLQSMLPGATAAISRSNNNQYSITINWDDVGTALKKSDNTTVAPSFALRVNL